MGREIFIFLRCPLQAYFVKCVLISFSNPTPILHIPSPPFRQLMSSSVIILGPCRVRPISLPVDIT